MQCTRCGCAPQICACWQRRRCACPSNPTAHRALMTIELAAPPPYRRSLIAKMHRPVRCRGCAVSLVLQPSLPTHPSPVAVSVLPVASWTLAFICKVNQTLPHNEFHTIALPLRHSHEHGHSCGPTRRPLRCSSRTRSACACARHMRTGAVLQKLSRLHLR